MKITGQPEQPMQRRRFLQTGSLLLGGLGLNDLLRLRAHSVGERSPEPDTSVILLWLEGGPSHMETYDLKPEAPAEYRGEFTPIPTRVAGLDVCELLPKHAAIADKFSLIRSISHNVIDHPGAAGRFLTGRQPRDISATVSRFPTFPAIVGRLREPHARRGVPQYISNKRAFKGGGTAYLGQTAQPFVIEGDPSAKDFKVANLSVDASVAERLDDRLRLSRDFDRMREDLDLSGTLAAGDRFDQRAAELLSSTATRDAFDLSQEDDRLRDRYGRNMWGQGALLARRLVEAGTSMVSLDWGGISRLVPGWDDHGDGQHIFKSMRIRLPIFDTVVSALIEDLHDRGHRGVRPDTPGEHGPGQGAYLPGPRPLAPGDVGAGFGRWLADGPGRRCYELQGRTPRQAGAGSQRLACINLPIPRRRPRSRLPRSAWSTDADPDARTSDQ